MTKDELKDEMKNRISMALKDPILQQGFEIICKENAELKAQIDEMKKELHHRLVSHSKSDSDCLDKIIGLDRLWQFGEEF